MHALLNGLSGHPYLVLSVVFGVACAESLAVVGTFVPAGIVIAGLHTSKLHGTALQYNQDNPYIESLLICRPELAEQITEAFRKIGAEGPHSE
ncbi:MAG: hypothetical protein KGJ16_13715 [Betaproteobacteria bacterium]|nr:hypothetical protein [Betaproteobacteria bacterium]